MAEDIKTAQIPQMDTTPPPVAGETPPDPNIIGDLSKEELEVLNSLRQQGNTVTMRIGLAELQKTRLLYQIQEIEDKAQDVMTTAGKRLGIADGQPWQITQNGKARLLATNKPTGFPPLQVVKPVDEVDSKESISKE